MDGLRFQNFENSFRTFRAVGFPEMAEKSMLTGFENISTSELR